MNWLQQCKVNMVACWPRHSFRAVVWSSLVMKSFPLSCALRKCKGHPSWTLLTFLSLSFFPSFYWVLLFSILFMTYTCLKSTTWYFFSLKAAIRQICRKSTNVYWSVFTLQHSLKYLFPLLLFL